MKMFEGGTKFFSSLLVYAIDISMLGQREKGA